jgi:cell division protease FtsH
MRAPGYVAVGVVAAILVIAALNLFDDQQSARERRGPASIPYSDFVSLVDEGRVAEVTLKQGRVAATLSDGSPVETYVPEDPGLIDRLVRGGVTVWGPADEDPVHPLLQILVSWLPVILLAIPLFMIARRQAKGWRSSGAELAHVVARLDKLIEAVERLAPPNAAGAAPAASATGAPPLP